jgi:phospholipid/cholesterol/gamma-HCH transport system substrate-binding protein
MALRKQLTWTELRVGLFVLVGLFVIAVGTFYVTGAGFWGPKYHLKTFLPDVSGLATGAPVSIDGVDVGNVETLRLVPRAPNQVLDKNKSIEVIMRLDRRYQADILTDSTASMVTQGLLGNRYVNISRGFTGIPLKDGQEVPGAPQNDIKEVMERSSALLDNLQAVSADAQSIIAGVKAGKGNLGKLITDEAAYNNLNAMLANGNKMVGDIRGGKGTIGKLVATDEMYNKVDTTVDNVNSILGDVRAQKGTLGKLLYDTALYDQVRDTVNNANGMIGDVRSGKGSLGKLATDDTLYNKMRDTSTNLANATAKLNDNTTTAGKLFSDPQLYDNLTGLTGDLRLLIGDFRQNPKKFLHFKVTLF